MMTNLILNVIHRTNLTTVVLTVRPSLKSEKVAENPLNFHTNFQRHFQISMLNKQLMVPKALIQFRICIQIIQQVFDKHNC